MSSRLISAPQVLEQTSYFTPWAIDTLKTIALLAMFIDHANTLLSMQEEILRMIGRCAFPLFGLIWAYNYARAEKQGNRQKSLNRLWLWAIITQPIYFYAFKDYGLNWHDANILFCFAGAGQALHWYKKESITLIVGAIAILLLTIYLTERSEYGTQGVVFLAICYSYFIYSPKSALEKMAWIITLCISVALLNPSEASMALSGVVLTLVILGAVFSLRKYRIQRYLPPQMFYYAYGGHIALFALLA